MSNDLAKIQSTVIPTADEWSTIHSMAKSLLPTGFLPETIKTPEQATAIILKGRELQVPPMYALSNIVVIKGKPACSAELLQALIYRDHGDDALRFVESTNDACTIEYRRRSWKKPERYTFTMDDAKKANLLRNPIWSQYPAAMLRARCISAVARMAFADSIGGMYTPEELGASVTVVDGVVELDPDSVIEVTPHAPVTRSEAPERTEADEEASEDDAITQEAIDAITQRADHRGLSPEDLHVLMWWRYHVEDFYTLTVDQGRDLYRYLHNKQTSGADLTAELDKARREDAERREFDTGDMPPFDEVVEHDNTPTSADMVALFDQNNPQQTNPMFS